METKSKSIEKVNKPEATPAHSVAGIRQRAVAPPQISGAFGVQSAAGNLAVQRLARQAAGSAPTPAAGVIQTKLAINKPGDEYEQEAERVSEHVMRMSEPQLQRACACGGACPKCQTEQPGAEHESLQTKRIQASDMGQTAVPPIVHEVLRSPGQPLDPATRAFMEPRFGHDFSRVNVHTDAKAAESAQAVNASAYTVGPSIVFGADQFAPHTDQGRCLLAHELTHVAQQAGQHLRDSRALTVSVPEDAPEVEAARIANVAFVPSSSVLVSNQTLQVARQPKEKPKASIHADDAIAAINAPLEDFPFRNNVAVNNILAPLPMNELLTTLVEVRSRGSFELMLALANNDIIYHQNALFDRVLAAMYIVRWMGTDAGKESIEETMAAAAAISKISAKDQNDLLDYLKANSAMAERASRAMEGVAAMQEEQSGQKIKMAPQDLSLAAGAPVGAGAGSYAPPPLPTIGPGPVNRPGNKWWGYYIGDEAHVAIAAIYESEHITDMTFYNTINMSSILDNTGLEGRISNPAALSEKELREKPDITNLSKHHLYEIKPVSQLDLAIAEALEYAALFNRAGFWMSPGPTTEPGTLGACPAPGGVYIFESLAPGAIVYKYRRGSLVPEQVPQEETAEEPSEVRWRYVLKPWQKAAILGTTASVGAVLILIILFSPAGV